MTTLATVLMLISQLASSQTGGDAEFLAILRDAQRANAARHLYGDMHVAVERSQDDEQFHILRRVDAHVIWDLPRVWVGASIAGVQNTKSQVPVKSSDQLEMIVDDTRMTIYSNGANTLSAFTRSQSNAPGLMQLVPNDFWYGRIDGEGSPWLNFLDPTIPLGPIAVRRIDEDRVEITPVNGADRARLVSSLAWDGNVVDWRASLDQPERVHSTTYQWARDKKDRCYLSQMEAVIKLSQGLRTSLRTTYRVT